MKYKIVYLKDKYVDMVDVYPQLVDLLYTHQNNTYETKQVELIFKPLREEKEKLLKSIQQRDDYSYYHGIHLLYNHITEDKVTLTMNEYDIDVEENGQNHIIFDKMKAFSKNFYMIMT
ncbi:MAG: sporulation inhibitor of replication protein SirA [Coprobacillus cateniformis]|nr:sporulation inhibitor of replication protein SirA [Coprobacillus cateniformis]